MKPFITSVAIAGLFSLAACNSSANKEKDAALLLQQHTIDSMNTEMAKRKVIDSMNEVSRMNIMIPQVISPVAQPQQVVAANSSRSTQHSVRRSTRNTHAASTRSNTTAQSQNTAYQETPARRKKGWSAKAKGAVIGTGVGAITGAVVNKRNRGAGAVIGGLLGAGAGTGVGAIIDHKNGR
jgi:hypothetical protein